MLELILILSKESRHSISMRELSKKLLDSSFVENFSHEIREEYHVKDYKIVMYR
jgi:hypothetical protein